jgi:hypothetical protein
MFSSRGSSCSPSAQLPGGKNATKLKGRALGQPPRSAGLATDELTTWYEANMGLAITDIQ